MAARSNDLHETALSPAEHEAWMLWVESLSSEMGQTMSHEQLLHRIQETFADDRNSSQTRSPRQDREVHSSFCPASFSSHRSDIHGCVWCGFP